MQTFLEMLARRQGSFVGRGVNHDDEEFTGRLSLRSVPGAPACAWDFLAQLESGVYAHVEHTLVALDEAGVPGLWTVSSNRPHMVRYALTGRVETPEGLVATFADGDLDDESRFRSQIRIELHAGGDMAYHHAWGLPGEPFAERSGVRMSPLK
jgi:hypothetical protein